MGIPEGLLATPFSPRYPEGIQEWIDVYGHAVPLWLTDPGHEYDAIRNRTAALEYSMLYKWHLEGPAAVAATNAVVSRNVSALRGNRLAYGVVVSQHGTMIDDITVAVLAPDHVVVTGGNPSTEESLRAAAPAGTRVTERRGESAVLSLQGPASRAILARLTAVDVSNAAFPYYTFRTGIQLAGIPAIVNRVGFTAELGYELIVPREYALALWDAVFEAGADQGVQAIGAAALMMCRIEAGMIMGDLEYDATVSPFECRMGWSVDLDKGPFQGRDALLARKDSDTGRVVTVRASVSPEAAEGARLLKDGTDVGYMTMAVPSPLLGGATLGMARVHRDAAAVGTRLTITGGDGSYDAEVLATPVYDPQRIRVRS